MSVTIDPGGGDGPKSVDVELNLVPFIDMMSCLVAFLLITAVWTNLAQIAVRPKGAGPTEKPPPPDERPAVAILVAEDALWLGTDADRRQIAKVDGAHDYVALRAALADFGDTHSIEIAAEDHVEYQEVIRAMDAAITQGFDDVGYLDPASLSVRFRN